MCRIGSVHTVCLLFQEVNYIQWDFLLHPYCFTDYDYLSKENLCKRKADLNIDPKEADCRNWAFPSYRNCFGDSDYLSRKPDTKERFSIYCWSPDQGGRLYTLRLPSRSESFADYYYLSKEILCKGKAQQTNGLLFKKANCMHWSTFVSEYFRRLRLLKQGTLTQKEGSVLTVGLLFKEVNCIHWDFSGHPILCWLWWFKQGKLIQMENSVEIWGQRYTMSLLFCIRII
jgi:hypothetical protein